MNSLAEICEKFENSIQKSAAKDILKSLRDLLKDLEKGESHILNFTALTGKKDEDYYVKRVIDGNDSMDSDHEYKKWFKWDMDIRGNRTAKIKVHYYIKMDRSKGVPNFTYALKHAKAYSGNIKSTQITINMPVNCKGLPFTTKKLYRGGSYLFTSFPKPKIIKNILNLMLGK